MANAKIKASAKVSATVIPMATVKVSANVKGTGNAARSEWMQYLSTKLGNGGTVAETIALISDQYDAMQLTQHSVLDYHRQIGASLLEIRSVVGKSDKMFGQFVANTELNVISRHDRTDMMWVAANWRLFKRPTMVVNLIVFHLAESAVFSKKLSLAMLPISQLKLQSLLTVMPSLATKLKLMVKTSKKLNSMCLTMPLRY